MYSKIKNLMFRPLEISENVKFLKCTLKKILKNKYKIQNFIKLKNLTSYKIIVILQNLFYKIKHKT